MSEFINWMAHWPAWVGVPIGIVISLSICLFLKWKWDL